jgi:hypothetical protein
VRLPKQRHTLTLFLDFTKRVETSFSIIINQSTTMSASREEEIVAEKLINEGMHKIMLTVC